MRFLELSLYFFSLFRFSFLILEVIPSIDTHITGYPQKLSTCTHVRSHI